MIFACKATRLTHMLLAGACPLVIAAPPVAWAQSTAEGGGNDAADIVVTGTILKRTDRETPSPVTVLSSESLAKAGITNMSDAVRSIAADNAGSNPTSFTSGFGEGSSSVSLRGLTVNSTLTLINGLRTANYPLADDGQRAFVDLNSIPNATVERVEVLKDGASSAYGADAIGGVVNIIMRKQFTGLMATVESGITQRGDGGELRTSILAGHGDLQSDGFNVYVSAEYERDRAIYNRNRGFPYNTSDLSAIGGDNNNPGAFLPTETDAAIVAPTTQLDPGDVLSGSGIPLGPYRVLNPAGCPADMKPVDDGENRGCEQNLVTRYGQIQPHQTRWGASARGTVQVNDDTQAYASISYYQNRVLAPSTPSSIRGANPIDTLNIVLPARLPDGSLNPNNPFAADGQAASIYYTFGDIASSSKLVSHVWRGEAGIEGKFGDDWRYSVKAAGAHSRLNTTRTGYLNIAGLISAVANGTYNFVDPSQNGDAIRSAIAPTLRSRATSNLAMLDATLSKALFDLPGGPLVLGVGASLRYESVNAPNENANKATLGLNSVSAHGSHYVKSGFFELSAPILKPVEINLSGRYDHYSDGYSHFSPKVGVKITPFRQLAIRGTFSKGFRAPSFSETTGSVISYLSAAMPCSAAVEHGATAGPDGTICSGGSAYTKNYSIGYNSTATPNIKPELSRSFTAGAIVQPASWLSFTVDYYNIKKTRVISSGALAAEALDAYYNGEDLPDGYSVTLDAVDPLHPGGIRRPLFVNMPYANAAALKTSGLDLSVLVTARIAPGIKFTSQLEVTKIFSFKFKPDDDSAYQEYVGTQSPYLISSGSGTPRYRGSWQNSLEMGRFTLTGTAYYTSGYKAVAIDQYGSDDCETSSVYQGEDPDFNCHVRRFVNVDLVGSYELNDNLNLYFNVVNLFDARAPLNAGSYTGANYNGAFAQAGAVGRLFRIGANIKF